MSCWLLLEGKQVKLILADQKYLCTRKKLQERRGNKFEWNFILQQNMFVYVALCYYCILELSHIQQHAGKRSKKGRPSLLYIHSQRCYNIHGIATLDLSIKVFIQGGVVTSFSTVVCMCINMQNFDIHQPEGEDWSILENDVPRP